MYRGELPDTGSIININTMRQLMMYFVLLRWKSNWL